jgi:hypothetical protein
MGNTTRASNEQTTTDDVSPRSFVGEREGAPQREPAVSDLSAEDRQGVQETCAHWWIIGRPITRFTGPGAKGELVEYTFQVCKKCQLARENECLLPEPGVYDMAPKHGWSV